MNAAPIDPKNFRQHYRGHSEYDSTSKDLKPVSSDNIMTKRVIELLDNGLQHLNNDSIEEALKEFMICEELYKKYYS